MIYLGIDPGAKGAIAIIFPNGKIEKIYDMPIVKKNIEKYKLLEILGNIKKLDYVFAYIEKCQYTPTVKGKGAFQFGKNVMAIEMALAALQFKHDFVRPQKWKKEFGLIKCDKKDSIMKAKELFPEQKHKFIKSKDGRAEACLIAEHARRHL